MRYLKFIYLLAGLGLLGLILAEVELAEVGGRLQQIGWGMALILAVYFVAFAIDSFTWQLALITVPLKVPWLYRIWKVRMAGEAFNIVMPAAGMGGEPVKVLLLKNHFDMGYHQSAASIILARTINLLALLVYLGVGFAFTLSSPALPNMYKTVAGLGLLALATGVVLFFIVQRLKIFSLAGTWLSRWPFARRIEGVLRHVRELDDRFAHYYVHHKIRFAVGAGLAFVNWMLGVTEVYIATAFLGHPVSFVDAWIIATAAELVRSGTFFIPGSIGALEGAFLLACTAVTGSPSLGIAVAVVRRIREIVWIVWGLVLAALFSLRAPMTMPSAPVGHPASDGGERSRGS